MQRLLKNLTGMGAVIALAACHGSGGRQMNEPTQANESAEQAEYPAGTPVREASSPAAPSRVASPGTPWDSVRPYITEGLNSRVARPVGSGKWLIRMESGLERENEPAFVMQAGDRALIQGNRKWQLLSAVAAGRTFAWDNISASDLVMDPEQGSFFGADSYGYLAAFSLADGKVRYRATVYGNQSQFRQFFTRRGTRWFIASWERDLNPHGRIPPKSTALEVRDFGDPSKAQGEFLGGTVEVALQNFEQPKIFAAVSGETAFSAQLNDLLVTDLVLKLRGRFSSEFEPLALSAAEERAYILAQAGGEIALWCIHARGERQYAVKLPEGEAIAQRPPAVGFDHRVFVYGGSTVHCIGADGKVAWSQSAGAEIRGIAVTPDDQLLVTAGQSLIALDSRGNKRVLRDFAPDSPVTPPAMSRDGDIFVASRTKLYRLTQMK
ncbi:MAG: PQQ-like beta-propeller repeat protein [Bryobacteraceae bacterium]|nr:PQQ-like beta-propeller repeat protein [Bryobacteraceae bacterium]